MNIIKKDDKNWWKNSVVYQIYPRSFMDSNGDGIGDLQGIISRLDYLKDLGIDVVWLSPCYESPNDDNGYDISDYQKIMNDYGTMDDWDKMIREMHDRGIRLIMDLVVNHTSDEHKWFEASRRSNDNEYRDYYIWRKGKEGREPNNWISFFGGSVWKYDKLTDEYYLHLFSKKQPDLNWENKRVREEIYSMMKWWLDKGVDGFRMDVINLISKEPGLPSAGDSNEYTWGGTHFVNGPRIHEFLQEMNREVLSKYPSMTVGETICVTPDDAALYTSVERNELNMIFSFELMDIDNGQYGKWDKTPFNMNEFKNVLTKWQYGLEDKGWNSLFLNNHDQPRLVSRFGDDGKYRVESAKMFATIMHLLKGTPYIYQGEEIGMTNVKFESISDYRDIETLNIYSEYKQMGLSEDKIMNMIYTSSRDNARTPMQWDNSENAGFTVGKPWIGVNTNYHEINAEESEADEHSILNYYKKLIRLRKEHPVIVHGSFKELECHNDNIFAYIREYTDEKIIVIANGIEKKTVFEFNQKKNFSDYKILLGNYDSKHNLDGSLVLNPYEVVVLTNRA